MSWDPTRDVGQDRADEWAAVVEAFAGKAGRGWLRAECPFCADAGKVGRAVTLGLNTATGGYNCFRCETRGRLPEHLLDEVPYLPPAEPLPGAPAERRDPPELPEQFLPLFHGPHAAAEYLDPARAFLRDRGARRPEGGLDDGALTAMFVGAAVTGRQAGRVIVPLLDYERPDPWDMRSWRGWFARDYTAWLAKRLGQPPPAVPRPHLNSRGLDREGYLYNEPALWDAGRPGPVFVVEGALDVAALWPDAVAVLGKPIESQLAKLVASPRPLVVALDGDAWEQGWALAMKLRFLRAHAPTGAVRLGPTLDPDDVPRAALDAAAAAALASFAAVPVSWPE